MAYTARLDVSHTPAACSFPGENARSWEALGEARPGQSSLSAGALRYRAWASGERGFRSDAGGVSLARGSGSEDANSWRRGELKEAASLSCHLPLSSDGSIRTLGSRTGRACHRCEGCGCPRLPA